MTTPKTPNEEELELVQTKCRGETWEEADKRNEHFINIGIEKGKAIARLEFENIDIREKINPRERDRLFFEAYKSSKEDILKRLNILKLYNSKGELVTDKLVEQIKNGN